MKRLVVALFAVGAMLGIGSGLAAARDEPPVLVFAAASLTNVLQELGDAFTKQSSIRVNLSFAASSALARQIENGTPADVFFSADVEWMDYLQKRNLIQPASRHDVVGNRLVLITAVDSPIKLKIEPHFNLLAALADGRLATGDPDAVPAGRYAKAALTTLGVWSDVADHLVRADSVRAAMLFVDRGEAPLGIVYQTDALVDKKVRVIDVFPEGSHAPIVYPIALSRVARPEAAKFIAYALGPAGAMAFKAYGFTPLH